jgi:hypothetical protein
LKISKIKKSPQFGWEEKLQRTAGFQTVRDGYLVFFQNPFENHRDINLDTHRHRQTDRSQTDWPASVGRNYRGRLSGPVLPYKICLSVRPSDCPGRFCRRIKTQNRRVGQTHGLSEFIYKILSINNLNFVSLHTTNDDQLF